MHEMDLASGVSSLMKEEMFPAAERGLDNCWSSDSSTLKAIIVEPIGPNAQKVRCVQHADCPENHLWAFIYALVAKHWRIAVSVVYFSCLSKARFAFCSWVCNSGTENPRIPMFRSISVSYVHVNTNC